MQVQSWDEQIEQCGDGIRCHGLHATTTGVYAILFILLLHYIYATATVTYITAILYMLLLYNIHFKHYIYCIYNAYTIFYAFTCYIYIHKLKLPIYTSILYYLHAVYCTHAYIYTSAFILLVYTPLYLSSAPPPSPPRTASCPTRSIWPYSPAKRYIPYSIVPLHLYYILLYHTYICLL